MKKQYETNKKIERRVPLYIREWRKFRGLTQADLVRRMRIRRRTTLVELEQGRVRARQRGTGYLKLVAQALGVKVPDLYRNPVAPKGRKRA